MSIIVCFLKTLRYQFHSNYQSIIKTMQEGQRNIHTCTLETVSKTSHLWTSLLQNYKYKARSSSTQVLICLRDSIRDTSRQGKFFWKLLGFEMENYPIIITMGMYWIEPPWITIYLTKAYKTRYIFILLREEKILGVIWLSGENSMKIYIGGRQIFKSPQKVHKRGRLKIK